MGFGIVGKACSGACPLGTDTVRSMLLNLGSRVLLPACNVSGSSCCEDHTTEAPLQLQQASSVSLISSICCDSWCLAHDLQSAGVILWYRAFR